MNSKREGHRYAVSCFLNYWEHLFQFSEVFEHGYASWSNGEHCPAFSNDPFLNQVLLNQKIQVFFQDLAVDVRFIHYMRQLQWPTTGQHLKNVYIHLKLGTSHISIFRVYAFHKLKQEV